MSTPTDEIEVDIAAADSAAEKKPNGADPDPITVETGPESAPAVANTILTPEKGVEKLQKQLLAETAAREAAQRHAAEASAGEVAARTQVQKTELDMVKGAIERLTQTKATLKAQYAAAMAASDWDAAGSVQSDMADNAAKLQTLENGKIQMEKAPAPQLRAPVDPLDEFCSRLSAPSATWVRAHPEFVRDENKKQQMMAAHQIAIARGHAGDTPGYFQSIEKTLDVGAPALVEPAAAQTEIEDDPMADAAKPVETRAAPAAAPVTRSSNGRSNIVRLSAEEVEMARSMDMKPEEYARQKVALKKEGRLQ